MSDLWWGRVGDNRPVPLRHRLVIAAFVAVMAATICYVAQQAQPQHPRDFSLAWFGARAMIEGRNPYSLVGPGLEFDFPWRLLYPATAMVAALPLTWLPRLPAAMGFVGISSGLLAYAITRDGWYRLPVFVSAPFLIASIAAQWSPLLAATLGLPWLAVLLAAKPTIGLAIMAGGTQHLQRFAIIGGIALLLISLGMRPTWPAEWIAVVGDAPHIAPPIKRFGGIAVLLAALRWKRPEARLLLAMALVPQTGSWYEVVPLFWIPSNRNESMILCMSSSIGWLLQDYVMTATNETEFNAQVGSLIIGFAYLPAVWMVIRRPNKGEFPASISAWWRIQ